LKGGVEMIIEKTYERLVNLGNYENIRVGVVVKKDFENLNITKDGIKDIKKMGLVLGKIAESIVNEQVVKIEQERNTKE